MQDGVQLMRPVQRGIDKDVIVTSIRITQSEEVGIKIVALNDQGSVANRFEVTEKMVDLEGVEVVTKGSNGSAYIFFE